MPIEKGTVCICVVGTKNLIWFKAQHTTVYSYVRIAKSNPKPTKISNVHSNCTLAVPSYSAPEWTHLFFELIFLHSEPDKQRIVLFIVLQLLLAAETFIQLDSSRQLQAPVRVSARPFWSSSLKWKVPFNLHSNASHWQHDVYLLFHFPWWS